MITIKKILCPVDFFPASDMAVDYAATLAARYGAKMYSASIRIASAAFAGVRPGVLA
jgi:hypothetical protein